jgi:multicomponent Na+:H+ antiporter subunit D
MIISAAGQNHLAVVWLMLQFASAGVIAHAGIKVPFFTFFGHDSGIRAKEPPLNMLVAMGIAGCLCVLLGVFPQWLYHILPYQDVVYHPYTGAHVIYQLQLLLFGIFAFYLLLKSGFYPSEVRAINLDTDWFYRKGARLFYAIFDRGLNGLNQAADRILTQSLTTVAAIFFNNAAAWITIMLPQSFKAGTGKNNKRLIQNRETIRHIFESGTVPLGVSAAVAAFFIVAMYILT